jgi:hypothetical protein
MRKTQTNPRKLVDRLEKKYQKKIRFQKYKSFSKQFRQSLSTVRGVSARNLKDDAWDMFNINDYEYIGR